jgi:hypothetical protein
MSDLRRNLRNLVVPAVALVSATVTANEADAAPPNEPPKPAPAPKPVSKGTDAVRLADLKLTPAIATAGSVIKVLAKVMNTGDAAIAGVGWTVTFPDGTQKTGSVAVQAHGVATFEATFAGADGDVVVTLDPANALGESPSERANNTARIRLVVLAGTKDAWSQWAAAVGHQIGAIIATAKSKTVVAEAAVNGPTLTVKRLAIGNVSFDGIKGQLQSSGVPADVASAVVDAAWDAYKTWAADYHAVVAAYPTFAATPAPHAPPTANLPFPVGLGTRAAGAAAFSADSIAAGIRSRLGARAKDAGAADAVTAISRALASHLVVWLGTQQVTGVVAKGPVPSFAPPYSPVGPVVGGENITATGPHLQ